MGNGPRLRWRLPTISAVVSAALGMAIAFTPELRTEPWAWSAVGVLVIASVVVSIVAENLKDREAEAPKATPGLRIGDDFENSGSKIGSGSIAQAGRDFAGRDIHYHQPQPLLRTVLVVAAVVWLAAAGGLVAGTHLLNSSDASTPQGDAGGNSTLGTLTLTQSVRYLHPDNGVLPGIAPPRYSDDEKEDFCASWAEWAKTVKAATTTPVMSLTTIAGATSPITILDLHAVIFAKHSAVNNNLIQCQLAAGGFAGTTAYLDLDHPTAPTPMDIGADGQQHTTLPGGRFAVDPKNAESLYMYLKGSPGEVYEFGIEMRVVENSKEQTRMFGSPADPYRLAFIANFDAAQYYDWDFGGKKWANVTGKPQ